MALTAMELRIDRFLHKPYDEFELLHFINDQVKAKLNSLKDDEDLLKGFVSEAKGLIEANGSFISKKKLKNAPTNLSLVNSAFGMIHTMKGNSGFFDPRTLHAYVHRFEDVLRKVQAGEIAVTPEVISIFLAALDQMRVLLTEFENHRHEEYDIEQLTSVFQVVLATAQQPIQVAETLSVEESQQLQFKLRK